ncbi:MAG TPA: transcriptional regulator GcvA [Burkholderiales bacterium]|nr:transcriptional regulator GcvA [Burkholderiales bacterium]
MSTRLPPLNALRAFESAARHLSFKQAARELNVTPAAISHQIKGLEDYLGVRLFHRLSRALQLTEQARTALPRLSEGFDAIVQAVALLRTGGRDGALTVSVAPSFAARWLTPRLHRFVTAHPDIDVRVSARMRKANAPGILAQRERETVDTWLADADVAVVLGHGAYPGLHAEKLLDVSVTPLCGAKLYGGIRPLRRAEDLRHFLLLHDDTGYFFDGHPFWDRWLQAAGVSGIDATHGPHFSHAALALEAAIDGLGVVASMPVLAEPDLSAGRLVAPFELRVPLDAGYWLVCRSSSAALPKVAAFRDWLRDEASTPLKPALREAVPEPVRPA